MFRAYFRTVADAWRSSRNRQIIEGGLPERQILDGLRDLRRLPFLKWVDRSGVFGFLMHPFSQ
jgi:hypothetical protein